MKRPAVYRPPGHGAPAERRARYERERGSARARGYTRAWDKASRAHLAAHPLCVMCAAKGLVVPARVTDHIVPHRGDPVLFWDPENWQSLCTPCHSSEKQRLEAKGIRCD